MQLVAHPSGNKVKLCKAETRKILEACYLIRAIAGVVPQPLGPNYGQLANEVATVASMYGSEYLDSNGNIEETPRRQAENASVPTTVFPPNAGKGIPRLQGEGKDLRRTVPASTDRGDGHGARKADAANS